MHRDGQIYPRADKRLSITSEITDIKVLKAVLAYFQSCLRKLHHSNTCLRDLNSYTLLCLYQTIMSTSDQSQKSQGSKSPQSSPAQKKALSKSDRKGLVPLRYMKIEHGLLKLLRWMSLLQRLHVHLYMAVP